MQVRYNPAADRLLWQVRTSTGELFAVWLTRRMVRQLWGPLTLLVTQAAVAQVVPHALVLPEAREMMAQAARSRQLPGADFATPFDPKPAAQPLGPEPLLPTTVDLMVTYTEPGLRGDTATNTLKPATVETGARIQVPLFVDVDTKIRIKTSDYSYVERVK